MIEFAAIETAPARSRFCVNMNTFSGIDDNPLTIAAMKGWVDTESRPRLRGHDDAKFEHASVFKFSENFCWK